MKTSPLERFPDIARWLASAPAPRSVEMLPGPNPTLRIDGVQLASRFDPCGEATQQARLVPEGSPRATLYGFAQGEIVRVLLSRPELKELRVVVLNPGVARTSLARCGADWLADPRIELRRTDARSEVEAPFTASPADLVLASDEAARLRDLVQLELATPFLRQRQARQENELRKRVAANEARFRDDPDASILFGSRSGAVLCVAAAGPSLARHYGELRGRAGDLVAVDAALKPLLEAGVVPAYVVTQDPDVAGMRRVFDVPSSALGATTLVYFPVVAPEVLAGWKGPRRVARGPSPLYDGFRGGRVAELFSSGSVLHPSVDLARRLGARRIELFGADFSMPGGASHVAGAAWARRRSGSAASWVLDGHGRRVPSQPNLVGYLRDLERWLERQALPAGIEIVQRSAEGAAIRGARLEEVARAG